MSPTPYAKPELPVPIGAWQIFCPACFDAAAARHPRYDANGLDFNHDHPELPDYPRIGGAIERMTVAEHNWLAVNVPSLRFEVVPAGTPLTASGRPILEVAS